MAFRNKYSNIETIYNGITFDSKLEETRYIYLANFEREGLIADLQCQIPFDLTGDSTIKKWRNRIYIADFVYTRDGYQIIEDVKSSYTAENKTFRKKKERMLSLGFYIKEIRPVHIPYLDLPQSIEYRQQGISENLKKLKKLYEQEQ